eukprot:4028405-Pyramimonas_sp.AAC.1
MDAAALSGSIKSWPEAAKVQGYHCRGLVAQEVHHSIFRGCRACREKGGAGMPTAQNWRGSFQAVHGLSHHARHLQAFRGLW